MDRDRIRAWVTAEQLSIADFLDGLDTPEWTVDSLCSGWTVRDVAAHLTLSTLSTFTGTFVGLVRARGNWERMEADVARKRAAVYTPAELIGQLRETAHSTRLAPFASPPDPLVDMLVHGQDMARPLRRERPMPVAQTVVAIDHVLASRFYGARKRLAGVRLTATDADWSAGVGTNEVRGPVGDLLLLATGRPAALAALSGSGIDRVAAVLE